MPSSTCPPMICWPTIRNSTFIRLILSKNFPLATANTSREPSLCGWSASMLLLLVDDVVVYKLWSGTPRVEERGKETNPLGPAQDLSDPARNAIPKP